MISQLLDEPYFSRFAEIQWNTNCFQLILADLMVLTYVSNGPQAPAEYHAFSYQGEVIQTQEAIEKIMNDRAWEVEEELIRRIYHWDIKVNYSIPFLQFEKMSLSDKCQALEISDYLTGRDVNLLALYMDLLDAMKNDTAMLD